MRKPRRKRLDLPLHRLRVGDRVMCQRLLQLAVGYAVRLVDLPHERLHFVSRYLRAPACATGRATAATVTAALRIASHGRSR